MSPEKIIDSPLVEVIGLTGRKVRNLDPKRRLTVNMEWRQLMGYPEYAYIAPFENSDGENYLELLPVQAVTKLSEELSSVLEDDVLSDVRDELFEGMEQVFFDGQGRIRIPDEFLEYAGIEENVVLSGVGSRIKVRAISEDEKGSIKVKSCNSSRKIINTRRRQLREQGVISR